MGRGKNIIIALCLIVFVPPLLAESAPTKEWQAILAQIQAGNSQGAIYSLKKLLESRPAPIWQKRGLFLLAYRYRKADELREAEEYFGRALKIYDSLRDYIELELCTIWLAQHKLPRAFELIKSFRGKYPNSPLLYEAQLLEAHILKGMGKYAQAIRKYREVIEGEGISNREKESEAIFGWAESLAKTGQLSQAWEIYRKLYFSYPEQPLAHGGWTEMINLDRNKTLHMAKKSLDLYQKRAEILMELRNYISAIRDYDIILSAQPTQAHLEKALLKKAFCLYKLKERPKAIALLEEFINKYPTSDHIPEGLYYLARLYWDTKAYSKGERIIRRLTGTYPSDAWAEKGMLVLGLMKEEKGKWSQAGKIYYDMKNRFPNGELLAEVYWRWGWTEYLTGNHAQAAEIFKDLMQLPQGESEKDKILYWYARALEKSGNHKKAQVFYEKLARNYPYSYYGIKGGKRGSKRKEHKHNFTLSGTDEAPIIPTDLTWTNEHKYYLERIRELTALALYEEVQHELKKLIKILTPEIPYQYHLAKFFHRNGFYYETIRILNGLLLTIPVEDRDGLPIELWQLLYPLAYWAQVEYHAKQNHQDPYLIMAMIRQESAFQSGAISAAGACGLMQILPSTGKFIFQSLNKDGFQKQYLFDSDTNISLGIWYFNYLKDKFDQNLIFALAGYNAGPGKVKIWVKNYGTNNSEEFIENIPYRETRNYVKNILRNRFFYQKIYRTKKEMINGR